MSSASFGVGDWRRRLKFNPLVPLLASKSESLNYFTRHDLLDEKAGAVEQLWQSEEVKEIGDRQLDDGAWRYHQGRQHIRSSEDYNQLETYRILRELVQKHGLNRSHPTIQRAAGFLFSHQTKEGDFRGILGNQYAPYYSAGIMELLIQAGYVDDLRIERGFLWLLSIRQDDGGWALPLRTVGKNLVWSSTLQSELIQPDKSKPFSHLITGMVLRAFAAHPQYRNTREARIAGELLASRFFKNDKYPDRSAVSFWTSFSYPFWFTDLISSLDSLSQIGLSKDDEQIQRALNWFIVRQKRSGLWELKLRTMAREQEPDAWITMAVCRVFKRFFD